MRLIIDIDDLIIPIIFYFIGSINIESRRPIIN